MKSWKIAASRQQKISKCLDKFRLQQRSIRTGRIVLAQSSFCIGDQSKMRGRIAGTNCSADFYQLLQKFGRL